MTPWTLVALALLSLLAADGALASEAPPRPAPPPPAQAEPEPADGDVPPPGSPSEQKLWKDANEASVRIITSRTQANKMQWRLRQGGWDERLTALSEKPETPDGKRARDVLPRLRTAAKENYFHLTRQWPVDPTRGCRYQVLNLEGVMYSAEHPRKAAQLRVVHEEVEECLEKAQAALKVMDASNAAFGAASAEAEALVPLSQAPATAPAAAAPQAATSN
jgi:hypothetical protein